MKTATASTTTLGLDAIKQAYQDLLQKLGAEPSLVMVSFSVNYDADQILKAVREMSPNVPLQEIGRAHV